MPADTVTTVERFIARVMALVLVGAIVWGCAPSEDLPPPPPAPSLGDITLPDAVRVISDRVSRGATLASLLRAHEITEADVNRLVQQVSSVFDPRKVRVNQPYRIARAGNGVVRRFEYEIDGDQVLRLVRVGIDSDESDFVAEIAPIEKTVQPTTVRGVIDSEASSLFAAMDHAGEEVELTLKLADVFSSEVDFNSEIQPGDSFELIVDKMYRANPDGTSPDETFAGYGPVVAAEFVNDGRQLRAFRFTPDGESPGYYDDQGRSLRRFFLRSPLKFDPIVTSGFSRSRMHPVLHVQRAHLGVDYRAPTGAPVIAVANGVVVSAGWSGGSGRMVHLRHPNGYETQYLHLSSIAVRRGQHITQGDLVGRVGSSGLATGPHLDYRLKKNGRYLNPVTAHRAMPPGDPIPAVEMPAFIEARDRALEVLQSALGVGSRQLAVGSQQSQSAVPPVTSLSQQSQLAVGSQ